MKAGDIEVGLRLNDDGFSVQIKNAGKVVKEMQKNLEATAVATKATEAHINSFSSRLRYAVTTISLARGALTNVNDVFFGMPRAIAAASGEIERMTLLMKGLAASTKEVSSGSKSAGEMANEWSGYIFDMARKSPFDVKALTDSFVKLRVAGIDPTDGSLQALTDSVAKYGGSSELLKRASVAIQQMAGKGVISMEELRQQLGEAVPDAIQLMANGVGLSMADLVKQISLGRVEASSALDRMFTMMKIKNDGAAAMLMDSWTGQLARLNTEWTMFLNNAGNAGGDNSFFNTIKNELRSLNEFMAGADMKKLGADLGSSLADLAKFMANVVRVGYQYSDVLKLLAQGSVLFIGGRKLINFLEDTKRSFSATMASASSYQSEIARGKAAELTGEIANNNAIIAKKAETYTKLRALQNTFAAQSMAKQLEMEAIERRQGFIGTKSGNYKAASNDAARLASNAAVIAAEAAQTKLAIDAARGLNVEKERMLKNAGGLMSKLPGLTTIIGALGGPIGIITTALISGAFAWYEWGKKAREAIESADRAIRAGEARNVDVKTVGDQVKAQQAVVDALKLRESAVKAGSKNVAGVDPAVMKKALDDLLQLQKKHSSAMSQAKINETNEAVRINQSGVEKYTNQIKLGMSQEISAREVKYKLAMEEASKSKASKKVLADIEQKWNDDRNAIAAKANKQIEATYTANIKNIAKLAGQATGAKREGYVAQIRNLTAQLNQTKADGINISELGSYNSVGGGKAAGKTAGEKQAEKFSNFMDGLRERIAAVNAELSQESSGTVAKLLEKVQTEGFNTRQLEEAKKLIEALNQDTNTLDITTVVDSGKKSLEAFNEELGGGLSIAGRLTAELDRVAKKAETAAQKTKLGEGYQVRDQLVEAQDQKVIRDLTQAYQKRAADLQASMASEQEAIRIRFEQERQEIEATFAKFSDVEKRKPEVVELHRKEIELSVRRQAEAMRTPAQRMVRDWEDATTQMRNATTGWMSNFVDNMVEMTLTGKASWGDMVESMLKDMLRIQYQKQMGGLLQGAMDGIASTVGDWMKGAPGAQTGQTNQAAKEAEAAGVLINNLGKAAQSGAQQAGALSESMMQTAVETGVQGVKSTTTSSTMSYLANAATAAANALNQLAASSGGTSGGGDDSGGFFGDLFGAVAGYFTGGASGGVDAGAYGMDSNPYLNGYGFANGGIMTKFGPTNLRKYANGGIANTPQLALYGEGSMPEAYVPLPDGRTIPVTMTGGMGGGSNVTVNIIGAPEGTKTEEKKNSDGSMSIDVIIAQVEGKISQNVSKGRGSLSNAMEKTYGLNRAAGAY